MRSSHVPAPGFLLFDDETLQIAFFAPAREHLVKGHRSLRVLALEKTLTLLFALAIVIAGSAGALVIGHEGPSGHQPYPFLLGLWRGLHRSAFAILHLRDDVGDMSRLAVEHIGEVRRKARLRETHMEAVREAVAEKAMKSLHPFCPVFG